MAQTMTNLDMVVQEYLKDSAFQEQWYEGTFKRNEKRLPVCRNIVMQFIAGNVHMSDLAKNLSYSESGKIPPYKIPPYLVEIRKLASIHFSTNPDVEATFRFILKDLSSQNLGERIEQFYKFAVSEQERLLLAGFEAHQIVSPNSSALIISIFAFWLDYPRASYIYYHTLRLGLAVLIKANLILASSDIKINATGVVIKTKADHQVVKQALDQLSMRAPQLKDGQPYAAERFFIWLVAKVKEQPDFLQSVSVFVPDEDEDMGEIDVEEADVPSSTSTAQETFDDHWLQAISPAALTQAIASIRRHVLVEERLIKRIYRALLTGHVILTGPPGTGKTELARLLPELLWSFDEQDRFAYATTLVTATSDWSTRTLISGIIPIVSNDKVAYRTHYGHLSQTIMKNWLLEKDRPMNKRVKVQATSCVEANGQQDFHGHWLVIDEFNRAPIDAALGEALTMLSNGGILQIPVDGSYLELPVPKDFRIIGTLNSFDRNYLNQISEALKRRFSFIEVPPPSRMLRNQEQNIVLYKALERCSRFSQLITKEAQGSSLAWTDVLFVDANSDGIYESIWEESPVAQSFKRIFYDVLWPLFEVIRIYRQMGTAQAITLVTQIISHYALHASSDFSVWLEALDDALCDAIADQLQVLLPDELDILLWYLKLDERAFCQHYNEIFAKLKPRRQAAHLEALSLLVDENGKPYLRDTQIEQLLASEDEEPQVDSSLLRIVFHLKRSANDLHALPQFTRRLRTFKAERGL